MSLHGSSSHHESPEGDALLRGLVETSPFPMLAVTSDSYRRVVTMSRRFTESFGYSIDDVPDIESWWPRAYPDEGYRVQVRRWWEHALDVARREGRANITPIEVDVTCRDGTVRTVEVHLGMHSDWGLVVFNDLTEQRRTERLLRQSEERYRLIVENQTEFIVKWLPDGTRTFVNDSYCRTFGLREDECLGTSFFPLVAPADRQAIRQKTSALTPEEPEYTEEHQSLVPGGLRWQQWKTRGIFDAHRRLVELLSTGRDITQRVEAEEQLRQNRLHLIASQRIAKVGSWEMDLVSLDDLSSNPIRWSDECHRLLGYGPDDHDVSTVAFIGRVHPDDRQKVRAAFSHATRSGAPFAIDHRIVLADKTERILHEETEVIRDPVTGAPTKVIGTTQDITDRVRLEEQLRQSQKMQVIGQLAGGVAHDFNNVLTVINGYIEMLLSEVAAEEPIHDGLTAIRDAGERAAQLTRQLLLFSRKAVLEARILDLNDIVQHSSLMLRRLIGEDVALTTTMASSMPAIRADRGQLEQVLLNLVLNARDAMNGGGRLTIETRQASFSPEFCRSNPEYKPGHFVQLIVTDTGCGMNAEVKAHLFEPFFTTKGPGKGTGLGLATVYGIVEESGGFITVSSEVAHGSTFNVFLPALDTVTKDHASESAQDTVTNGHEMVLVVEDEERVRQVVTAALERQGYRVLVAADGPAAMRLMDTHGGAIDLLLTDVVMPGMSGGQLASRIRQRHPRCRVLFMSGYNGDLAVDHGQQAPGEAFLQKPFTTRVLARKVREVLEGRT